MKFSAISAALLLAALVTPIFAKEPPAPAGEAVSVEIAAPPMEGTVSIGVFDATGKCIRVLAKNAAQEKIPSALNGFLISWDGKTDADDLAEKGGYEIRGVTVGDVKVTGDAWHFNDWIDPEKPTISPDSTTIVRLLENDGFIVLQPLANGSRQLARYSAKGVLEWSSEVPIQPTDLTIVGQKVFLVESDTVQPFDLEKGTAGEPAKSPTNIVAIASNNVELCGVIGTKFARLDPVTLQPEPFADVPPGTILSAMRGNLSFVSDGTAVYCASSDHFEKIEIPLLSKINHLAVGKEGSFWLITPDAKLTEFDNNGQPLRSLEPEADEKFLSFDVNAADNRLAVVSSKPDRQRFRILQLAESATPGVSLWKTILQKDIQPCAEFGIDPVSSKVIPKGELPAEKSISVSLIENDLTPGRKNSIAFTPASLGDGLWLTTKGGLPLVQVASDLTSQRVAIVRGDKPDSLHLYAGTGAAVAEFSIHGLQNMMQFTSEKIQWPPGPKQTADEKNVPSKEPAPDTE